MAQTRCWCGKLIDLKLGQEQMEYVGSGEDDTDEYAVCRFCGKLFK